MVLSSSNLQNLLSKAITASKKAGAHIKESLNKEVTVQKKDGGDSIASQVVTQIDFESQDIILSELKDTFEQYDLGLLTEEQQDDNSRFVKDYFWCIDPLDGTLAFTEKKSGFAVSIALVKKDGKAVIGVVFDPYTETLYHATESIGAFKNNERWNLLSEQKSFYFISDRSFLNDHRYQKIINQLKTQTLLPIKTISHGGAVMNAIWAIEKEHAVYFKFPKKTPGGGSIWDYAATSCIYTELGLPNSDFFNIPLLLNSQQSTFMNERGVFFASNNESKEISSFIKDFF